MRVILTALDVLRRDGNAMDAAVAAIALLGVVEAPQTGIGGDCSVLYMPRGEGEIIALNGSGWAPAAASLDRCLACGMTSISPESADAVVPGAVGSWARLIADHGTMKLADLLQPAIALAEGGYPVSERVARDWARQFEKLRKKATATSIFLPDGAAPRPGDIHRQPALAAALRSIANDGPAAFYEGWIAREMVDALRAAGGCHALEDFSAYAPEYVTPIGTSYRGYEVWECPPNGQGRVPLLMLKALEGFDLSKWSPLSVERWHALIEIARHAYADRDCFIGDPRTDRISVKNLLSDERSTNLRESVSMERRMEGLAPFPIPDHRDTVFLAVVDSDRNTVAFINSIFDDFGSGIVSPAAGVIFHNRGSGFVLQRGHPNAIAGRKRPLNTIIPAMVTQNGKSVMPFGVTGGQFQPFGQVAVVTNVIDYTMGIRAAIDAPRIFGFGDTVQVEGIVPAAVVSGLSALGHHVVRAETHLGRHKRSGSIGKQAYFAAARMAVATA